MVDVVDINNTTIDLSKPTTQAKFGDLVGVSQQAVADLDRRGVMLKSNTCHERLQLYCSHLREQAAGRATSGDIDLATERAKLAKEQRIRVNLQNLVTRRQYGPIVAMEIGVSHVVAMVVSKLDTITGKLKKRSDVLTANDLNVVEEVIASVRNELGDVSIDWFDDMDYVSDDEETTLDI